jgi:hypothetical protein
MVTTAYEAGSRSHSKNMSRMPERKFNEAKSFRMSCAKVPGVVLAFHAKMLTLI